MNITKERQKKLTGKRWKGFRGRRQERIGKRGQGLGGNAERTCILRHDPDADLRGWCCRVLVIWLRNANCAMQ